MKKVFIAGRLIFLNEMVKIPPPVFAVGLSLALTAAGGAAAGDSFSTAEQSRSQVQKMREDQSTFRNEIDNLREKQANLGAEIEILAAEMKELSVGKGIQIQGQ